MSKAEKRALERFPVHEGASKEWIEMHLKGVCAEYIDGYHQAEKDLKLTWEDIKVIEKLLGFETIIESPKEFYQKVLKRFKSLKKRKRNENGNHNM